MTDGQVPEAVRAGIRRRWVSRLIVDVGRCSVDCATDVDADQLTDWANALDDISTELRRLAAARQSRPLIPCDQCHVLAEDIASHKCRP